MGALRPFLLKEGNLATVRDNEKQLERDVRERVESALSGVEVLAVEPDVMLGIDREVPRNDVTTTVPAGATLLLYTDGLVERREQHLDDGIARLVEVVSQCLRDGIRHDALTEAVIDAMVGAAADDDVAVLVVQNPA